MNYKSKIKFAAVIGVVILVLIFILMITFVSNNKTSTSSSNTITTTTSIEVDMSDAKSIAIKDENLVKLNSDLEEETILNDFDYDQYAYYNNTIYIAKLSDDGKTQIISSIDLESNMETQILNTEYCIKNSFNIYENSIYYVTEDNIILEYNIESEKTNKIVIAEDNQSIENCKIDKDNEIIYYMENVLENDNYRMIIYKFDLNDDSNEAILSAEAKGSEIHLYENYISFSIETNNQFASYIFNLDDNSFWQIGSYESQETNNYVAFSENYIIFSDGENITLTDYEGNVKNSSLYTNESGIYDISMLTESILQIRIGTEKDNLEIKTINFETSKIKDSSNSYSDVLNLW